MLEHGFAVHRRRLIFIALIGSISVGISVGTTTIAYAQPDARTRADSSYKEGIDLAKAGKNDAALAKFEASRAAFPSARAVFQMARMQQLLGQHDLAIFYFRQALRDETLPEDNRREATRAIEDLKTKIGVITLDVPNGANISLDGNAVADPTAPLEVAPGLHIIKVTLGGESRLSKPDCKAGKVVVVKIRFDGSADDPNGAATKGPPSTPEHTTPPPPPPTLPDDKPTFWTTPHTIGVVLAGVAVVGAGLGVGFLISHESNVSKQQDLAKDPLVCANASSAPCLQFHSDGDSASTASTIALVSFIGMAAAGAGAAVLLWPRTASTSNATSTKSTKTTTTSPPRLVPNGRGLAIVGTF